MDDDSLEWVRFYLEDFTDPNLNLAFNQHTILINTAKLSYFKIFELLIEWRADIKGSNALTMTPHIGRADPVKSLLHKGADVNEMVLESIFNNPEIEGTALQEGTEGYPPYSARLWG